MRTWDGFWGTSCVKRLHWQDLGGHTLQTPQGTAVDNISVGPRPVPVLLDPAQAQSHSGTWVETCVAWAPLAGYARLRSS